MYKSTRFAGLIGLFASVTALWFVWNHLTNESLEEASVTAQTILERMKTRSINHSFLQDNDEAKSLVRLLDKTREIAARERDMRAFTVQSLRDYLLDQRLSGSVVLNADLEPVTEVKDEGFPWREIVRRDSVKDVLLYPRKQFADRELVKGGFTYDFAVVARTTKPGLVVAWEKKDLQKFGMTSMDLYPGDAFALESLIFVVRNGRILATNLEGWAGKLQKDCPYLTASIRRLAKPDLSVHEVEGKNWFGRVLQAKGHQIFVLMPEKAVFQRRTTLFGEVLFVFVLFLGLLALVRMKTSQRYVNALETQFNTIKGISSVYISTYLVRMPQDTVELLKAPPSIQKKFRPGMRATEFFRVHLADVIAPEAVETAFAFFDPATLSDRLTKAANLETKLPLKDGRWVGVLAIPQKRNEYGVATACLLMSRDITEERRHEMAVQKQLLEAAESAKSAAVAKVQFLRHMSHDVRTPINGIRGMVELARRAPQDLERQAYCREKIWMISGTLLELVNDVLDMSKLDAGGERLEQVPFDVSDLMDELSETAGVIAKKQGVEIKRFMQGDAWRVVGSRKHLRRICTNLIFNAIKFTPAGGSVTIGCRADVETDGRQQLQFVCADTGRGMSKDFQKHVFEPFLQEDAAAARTTYQGTGLGLVITKQLTELMGGHITFVSEQGKGTTFTVTVPLVMDETPPAKDAETAAAPKADVRGMRVLLAEDNDINREIARCFLEDAGVTVTEAQNGDEAVAAFEASPVGHFDLILMDIMMPVTDGLAATRRIRALPRPDAETVPIVAMTANVFDDDIAECFRAGMNEHLTKPLDSEKLLRVLSVYRAKKAG